MTYIDHETGALRFPGFETKTTPDKYWTSFQAMTIYHLYGLIDKSVHLSFWERIVYSKMNFQPIQNRMNE